MAQKPAAEAQPAPKSNQIVREEPPAPQLTKEELREKRRKRRRKEFRSLILRIAILLLVVYVLFFHIVGVTIMPNGDMSPRLEAGDLVMFYRLGRDFHSQDVVVLEKAVDAETASAFGGAVAAAALSNGQKTTMDRVIAAFHTFDRFLKTTLKRPLPETPGETYVLRIVAAPGDVVEISEGERLIVNGNTVVESNIFYSTPEYLGFVEYPLTLEEDEYFVLADHRQGGADSRFFGPVKENEILGVAITVARRNNL